MNKYKLFPWTLGTCGVLREYFTVSTNMIMDLHEFHSLDILDKDRAHKVHLFYRGLPSPVRRVLLMDYATFLKPHMCCMRFEDSEYCIRCTRIDAEKWLLVYYWHI